MECNFILAQFDQCYCTGVWICDQFKNRKAEIEMKGFKFSHYRCKNFCHYLIIFREINMVIIIVTKSLVSH